MRERTGVAAFILSANLAACGGGGGSGPSSSPVVFPTAPPPTPCPAGYTGTAPACVAPQSTTTATGTVVEDGTGAPLAGVPVKLMPWAPCGPTPAPAGVTPENDGCPTPLPSPQATTAADGSFTLGHAPNGHYLLVIGTDSTTSAGTVQATVHDSITLTGGPQALKAPTLPPVPTVTPPAWETNGDYRIATLNATTELPCFQAWQSERATNGLAAGTNDEWLLENVRAVNTYYQMSGAISPPWPGNPLGVITTGGALASGGSSCSQALIPIAFTMPPANRYGEDPRAEWFAGQYIYATGRGLAEFTIDPRSFTDPNVPVWP